MVLNSMGVPPASRTPCLTASATWRRWKLQGPISVQVLAMPMMGLCRSSLLKPTRAEVGAGGGAGGAFGEDDGVVFFGIDCRLLIAISCKLKRLWPLSRCSIDLPDCMHRASLRAGTAADALLDDDKQTMQNVVMRLRCLGCGPEFFVVFGFEGVELGFVAQGEADVVEAVQQAVLAERVDVEVGVEALVVGDGLGFEVDGDVVLRVCGAAVRGGFRLRLR